MTSPIIKLKDWNKTDISNILVYPNDTSNIIRILRTDSNILVELEDKFLSGNTDVSFSTLLSGQTLIYSGGTWLNKVKEYTINNIYLNDNLDVITGSTTENSFLIYRNTNTWADVGLNLLTNNFILDSDGLEFNDSSSTFKPFEDINKDIVMVYDTLNGNGISDYPSRYNHKHDLLYSQLFHSHTATTIGVTESLNLIYEDEYKTYNFIDGLVNTGETRKVVDPYCVVNESVYGISIKYYSGDTGHPFATFSWGDSENSNQTYPINLSSDVVYNGQTVTMDDFKKYNGGVNIEHFFYVIIYPYKVTDIIYKI